MHLEDDVLVGAVCAGNSINFGIKDGEVTPLSFIISIVDADTTPTIEYQNYKFIQSEELTEAGVAVHPWGGIIIPFEAAPNLTNANLTVEYGGELYVAPLMRSIEVGTEIVFSPADGGDTNN